MGDDQNLYAWIISLPRFCPLPITHKKTCISCLCQENVKAAWPIWHEDSRAVGAAGKQKMTKKKKINTPGWKVPLRSSSPASCSHDLHHHLTIAQQRQLSKTPLKTDSQLKLPVPSCSLHSDCACKWPLKQRNF